MIKELETYINKIDDKEIRDAVFAFIDMAPKYFWVTPASSTGRYHPSWSLGPDGLQKHTVFGMHIALELARTYGLNQLGTDIALAASALHDTCKYGVKEEMDYSYFNVHPYIVRTYYDDSRNKPTLKPHIDALKQRGLYDIIMKAVERHMGSIATGEWNPLGLKPETEVETVVHLADYMASRKGISFDLFEAEDK